MENSLSLTWNLRFYGLMSRVTLQPHTCGIQTGPFTQEKSYACSRRLVLLPGKGTPATFAVPGNSPSKKFPQFLLPFRAPGFPGK